MQILTVRNTGFHITSSCMPDIFRTIHKECLLFWHVMQNCLKLDDKKLFFGEFWFWPMHGKIAHGQKSIPYVTIIFVSLCILYVFINFINLWIFSFFYFRCLWLNLFSLLQKHFWLLFSQFKVLNLKLTVKNRT